jgi:hypothetical protein
MLKTIFAIAIASMTAANGNAQSNALPLNAQRAGITLPGTRIAVPDVMFDDAAMRASAARSEFGVITLKNTGASPSKPFNVKCDIVSSDAISEVRTSQTTNTIIPAITHGQSYATGPGYFSAAVLQSLNCAADTGATSGEINKLNNRFAYVRAARANERFDAPFAPRKKIPFDVAPKP